MRPRSRTRGAVAGLTLWLAACAPAAADVYWANQGSGAIGRAGGGEIDQRFVTGASAPTGVALDGTHVYWSHGDAAGRIGRARDDGAGVDHGFLSIGQRPGGVASDGVAIYWTHRAFGFGWVGRALAGRERFEPGFMQTGRTPCGVAVDPDRVYWANGGRPGSIGRSHGRFDPEQAFLRATDDPCGVAVTESHVYWANWAGGSIGRARLDGTRAQPRFIAAAQPCGVAVDGRHVYWSTSRDTIGRATREGRSVDEDWVTGARRPCGVAVDPTLRPVPRAHRFGRARVGGPGAIRAVVLVNTSSSPLDVARARVTGGGRRHFAKTGDSCSVNPVPAGGACVLNVRFAPLGVGVRRAWLRVVSNTVGSPARIPLSGRGTR